MVYQSPNLKSSTIFFDFCDFHPLCCLKSSPLTNWMTVVGPDALTHTCHRGGDAPGCHHLVTPGPCLGCGECCGQVPEAVRSDDRAKIFQQKTGSLVSWVGFMGEFMVKFSRWWFQMFFIFPPLTWGNDPI